MPAILSYFAQAFEQWHSQLVEAARKAKWRESTRAKETERAACRVTNDATCDKHTPLLEHTVRRHCSTLLTAYLLFKSVLGCDQHGLADTTASQSQ